MRVRLTLLLLIMLYSTNWASAQKLPRPFNTVKIGTDSFMTRTEVVILDWLGFIADNNFDQTLFPDNKGLSPSAQLIFDDFKHGGNYKYISLHPNRSTPLDIGKLSISTTKAFDELERNDTNYFSLTIPITGISFTQALRFCKWKERLLNIKYPGLHLTVALPSKQVYAMVITNIDSLCNQHCDSCKQYTLNSISSKCHAQIKDKIFKSQGLCLERGDTHWPNKFGLYNIQGNAAEMTSTEGIAMGGSFRHFAWQSHSDQEQHYNEPTDWLGFRYIVTYLK